MCENCCHSRRIIKGYCFCVPKGGTVRMADKTECKKFVDKTSVSPKNRRFGQGGTD